MTAWITVKTNRFKAAQADRMISNFWSWYGSSDAQGLTDYEFYGKPWDNPALYDSLSPIRYIRKVKTPTLIVQSEEDTHADHRRGAVVHRAQAAGTPFEFLRYPRSTHELSRTGGSRGAGGPVKPDSASRFGHCAGERGKSRGQ
jgi:dipeptidyl aminopeptidase/acylaminoacyl peptidase